MSEEVKAGQEPATHPVLIESPSVIIEYTATQAADQPAPIETENLNRIFLPYALEQALLIRLTPKITKYGYDD